MNVPVHILVFYIVSLVRVVEPQHTNHQPCLVCGDSVVRIWSMMSRQGDRYLRIANGNGADGHAIVDCAGSLQNDNFTSLSKIRETSTFTETRIQLVFKRNYQHYHLYATSTGGVLAMPASDGEKETDNRNTWAPERLAYEHQLFTVFQSVKFRGYYLSCDGNGNAGLQQIINKAYREPNQLFLTVDPGDRIKGVTFDAGTGAAAGKREIIRQAEANSPIYGLIKPPRAFFSPNRFFRYASVVRNFDLPQKITFVLCFWINTTSTYAQLMSVMEETRVQSLYNRRRHRVSEIELKNLIDVSIFRGTLRLHIGYKRIERMFPNCGAVTDGKFHQICISVNDEYQLELYQDGKMVRQECLPSLASDFKNNFRSNFNSNFASNLKNRFKSKNNLRKRRGKFILGQGKSSFARREFLGAEKKFVGSLFQVNLWDQYPSFRIKRIATNCGCGGGSLVRWSDLLKGKMSNVNFDTTSECPKLEGYNYDALTQNRLI